MVLLAKSADLFCGPNQLKRQAHSISCRASRFSASLTRTPPPNTLSPSVAASAVALLIWSNQPLKAAASPRVHYMFRQPSWILRLGLHPLLAGTSTRLLRRGRPSEAASSKARADLCSESLSSTSTRHKAKDFHRALLASRPIGARSSGPQNRSRRTCRAVPVRNVAYRPTRLSYSGGHMSRHCSALVPDSDSGREHSNSVRSGCPRVISMELVPEDSAKA